MYFIGQRQFAVMVLEIKDHGRVIGNVIYNYANIISESDKNNIPVT